MKSRTMVTRAPHCFAAWLTQFSRSSSPSISVRPGVPRGAHAVAVGHGGAGGARVLPDPGPRVECLLERFRARSPLPGIYDALTEHAARGGALAAAPVPAWALAVLSGLVEWKLEARASPDQPPELYALHVLEVRTG